MKKTIQVKLDEEDVKRVRDEAKARGHTVSSLLRYIVAQYLKKLK